MKIKPFDILLFMVAVSILVFLTWEIYGNREGTPMVLIQEEGVEYLYPLTENRILEFEGPSGISVVVIEEGHAFVRSSECKQKICVQMGKIKDPGQWVACLPNQLLIRINAETNKDGNEEKPDGYSY